MRVSKRQLSPFSDPDEILNALHTLDERVPELRDALVQLLGHNDPGVRAEAVRVLIRRWKDQRTRPVAFELLHKDANLEVREAAVYAIASTASGDTLNHDTRIVIELLKNETEPFQIRGAAYDALLIMHRKPQFPTKQRDFDPTEDVDWRWVESLVRRPGKQ